MPLTVYLSSAPDLAYGAQLFLGGAGIELTASFPEPGRVATYKLRTHSPVIDNLNLQFLVDGRVLRMSMNLLPADSSMSLLALRNRAFLGGVYHAEAATGCVVRCENGKEGINCIVCESSGITARICC